MNWWWNFVTLHYSCHYQIFTFTTVYSLTIGENTLIEIQIKKKCSDCQNQNSI